MMKNMIGALAFATAFIFTQSASALVITATLDSFEATPHTIAGIGTGGGRGTFTLTGADAVVPTALQSVLDASFQAVCLEPDSFVSTGTEYRFLVTDLAFAPTTTGGMGLAREALVETVLGRVGATSVEDFDLLGVGLATALLYEAGYEAAVNALDLNAGSAVVTGAGSAVAQTALFSGDPQTTVVDAFALLNIGTVDGIATRSIFEGQDFMVFAAEAVPTPGSLPMLSLGLGLIGMVGLRKKA